jgi:hypothetical protein
LNSAVAGPDPRWPGLARRWGLLAGTSFIVATLVWSVDALGLMGSAPPYTETSAGQLTDESAYWATEFAYRRATLWNYAVRDGFFFVGYLALVPLVLAANAATAGRSAKVQIGGLFVLVAAVFGALNAVVFLGSTGFWRHDGWAEVPPEVMVAAGRDTVVLDVLSGWAGVGAYAALAVGLAHLASAFRDEPELPTRLAPVAWIAVVLLVGLLVVGQVPVDTGPAWPVLGLALGVVAAPVFAIGLGVHLGRRDLAARPT